MKHIGAGATLGLLLSLVLTSTPAPASADEGFRLPWRAGLSFSVLQGWGGSFSHSNTQESYAYDFDLPEGTVILASKGGTVTDATGGYTQCGGADLENKGNRVTIRHDDGSSTLYLHLQRVDVVVGQAVTQSQAIGLSGKTGYTGCAAHLHFQRQAQGIWITNSRSVYFDEYPGRQLTTNQAYTSSNGAATLQAPAAPSNLGASALSTSSIRVGWSDASSNETSFVIQRWNGSSFVDFSSVGANSTSWTNTGLASGSIYYYNVCAVNSAGRSCTGWVSATTQAATLQAPAAPSNLGASALSTSSIRVGWSDASSNETSFVIQRWNGSSFVDFSSVGANSTSWTNTGLASGSIYYYNVCAVNSAGRSCTGWVSATTQAATLQAPAAPSNLGASALSTSSIRVGWSDASSNETSFVIQRWNGSSFVDFSSVGANSTSWTNTGLASGSIYYYNVCAVNSAGRSCTGWVSATTQAATLQAPAAPSNLGASALSTSSIRVGWSDASSNETSFVIQRWNGSSFVDFSSVGANSTSWTNTGLASGSIYYYNVCAVNSAGRSCTGWVSATTQAATLQAPAAPSNLGASALSTSSIRVGWSDASSNETSFVIQRWNGSSFVDFSSVGANSTSWTNTGLASGSIYYYNVCAVNSAGRSCTGWVSATTQAATLQAPAAPSNLGASPTNSANIHATWIDNATNEQGYRITNNVNTVLLGANATSFDWPTNPSTYQCLAVQAYNSAGASAWSPWTCTTTPAAAQSYQDVVVDDQSGGFAKAGTAGYWHEASGGYGGHYWWTYTNASGVDDRATWTPSLPATGRWEVYVFVPSPYGTTTNARYRVDHQGVSTTVSVNQNNLYNVWYSLGTYTFSADSTSHVFMGDETYEAGRQIAFDAVKWVWRGS